MKCSAILSDLTDWAIDHPESPLPARLQEHINQCPHCRNEWESIRGWRMILAPQKQEWTPERDFFERLTEQAMQEKRRAALTDSIRRDLALDDTGPFSIFQRPFYRWIPAFSLVILFATPLAFWGYSAYNHIGEFDYTSGLVIAQADSPLEPHKGGTIYRNTRVQTPQDAESIVQLNSDVEVCIAPLSQITFETPGSVRVEHGKAYFDVAKQKSGFIVELPYGSVRVLGTAFEISVFQDTATITVTRGTVEVFASNSTVRVEQGMESSVVLNQHPSQPTATFRIQQALRWVTRMRENRYQEELRKYYPSLAAPSQSPDPLREEIKKENKKSKD